MFIIPFYYFLLGRVLLLVTSLRKKFAGMLSDKDILGSKHVSHVTICIHVFLRLADALCSVSILMICCCKVLTERRASSDAC